MQATLGGIEVEIHTADEMGVNVPIASGLLGLDVETTYMTDRGQFDPDFRVRTVQVATKTEAWVFDLDDPDQREECYNLLRDDRITFCSHSNMDVLSVAVEFGIDLTARNVDTLSLAQMVRTDKSEARDLKSLAADYGMPELEAAEKVLHTHFLALWTAQGGRRNARKADIHAHGWSAVDVTDPAFVEYAALDAVACRRLVELLVPATQAPAELLRKEQWLDAATNRLQIRGMRVDTERLDTLLTEARDVYDSTKRVAEKLTEGVNINGPKLIPWFAEHGVEWTRWEGDRTDTGAPSLAKENVELLRDFPLDGIAKEVVELLEKNKATTDLLRKTEDIAKRAVRYADGITRIHPAIHPHGATTTGRMSSSGPNVQNFSKKDARHRGLFLPEPGHTLVTIDFDQVELRVVAALAREEVMIETIKAGGDLHQLTADMLADQGVTISRHTAKHGNFLIVYGGGPPALVKQSKGLGEPIPLEVARQVVYGIREAYPSIDALSKWLGYEKHAIRTISNRLLPVTRNGKGELRTYASLNYAVQSAARELLVDAWHRFEVDFGHAGLVWLPIHDELVLQIPGEPGEVEFDRVVADAERAMRMDFMGVPITASAVPLIDAEGVSRWMPGDIAEKIAKEKAA